MKCLYCLHILVQSVLLRKSKGKTIPQELSVSLSWQTLLSSSFVAMEFNFLWTLASELQWHALRLGLGIDHRTAEVCTCNLSVVATGIVCSVSSF